MDSKFNMEISGNQNQSFDNDVQRAFELAHALEYKEYEIKETESRLQQLIKEKEDLKNLAVDRRLPSVRRDEIKGKEIKDSMEIILGTIITNIKDILSSFDLDNYLLLCQFQINEDIDKPSNDHNKKWYSTFGYCDKVNIGSVCDAIDLVIYNLRCSSKICFYNLYSTRDTNDTWLNMCPGQKYLKDFLQYFREQYIYDHKLFIDLSYPHDFCVRGMKSSETNFYTDTIEFKLVDKKTSNYISIATIKLSPLDNRMITFNQLTPGTGHTLYGQKSIADKLAQVDFKL